MATLALNKRASFDYQLLDKYEAGIVLTGSVGSATKPFNFENEINKYFKNKYSLKIISKESGAIGAAQIARDVYNGKKEILGILVDY